MRDTEYAYAVASVKVLENKMLGTQDLDALLGAESYDAAKKLLSDRGYQGAAEKPLSEALKSEMERAWNAVREVCPADAPLDILLYQNDFHNLKTILKACFSNTDWRQMVKEPSIADPEEIEKAVKTRYFEDLPDFLQEPAAEAYKLLTETYDGQLAEMYLDRETLLSMRKRAEREKNGFLRNWTEKNILIADLKIALRANRRDKAFLESALIPGNLAGDGLFRAAEESREAVLDWMAGAGYPADLAREHPAAFDQWCSAFLMDGLSEARRSFFGFEPILAYLIGKQAEIQAVRIILSGKLHGVEEKMIRERLRELYV